MSDTTETLDTAAAPADGTPTTRRRSGTGLNGMVLTELQESLVQLMVAALPPVRDGGSV